MFVYVLNKKGKALMPCKPQKARKLLKNNKAKVVNRTPFTIQLLYGSSGYKQQINLGVDAGSRYIGLSATTKKKELFKAEVELRQDISKLLENRRSLRRSRRHRKLRYRPVRFNNRKKKGKVAPTIQHKIDCHITIIRKVCSILPVVNIIIETAEFDIHKLKNPNISSKEYQNGEQKDFYNVKAVVLNRDDYKCQICGAKDIRLEIHHIQYRSKGGSNRIDNLVTLCSNCHSKIHSGELEFNRSVKSFKHASHMNIMKKRLIQSLKNEFDNVFETFGYLTKYNREKLNISKSHSSDAFVISSNFNAKRIDVEYQYKKVRRHNRQLHKSKPSKGAKRRRNQSNYIINGFRRFDKVIYDGIECFITGKRTSGYFQLKTFDGTVISQSVSSKKLKLLEPIKGWLINMEAANPLQPVEVVVSLPK